MAERPIFIPSWDGTNLVKERSVVFNWSPGMAPSQKKKNVISLHDAAKAVGLYPLLEISSKSEIELGRRLSAFSLKLPYKNSSIPLESAFQGSKVFEQDGPFNDLYIAEPRYAKRDERLKSSGPLKGFKFEGREYPLEPKTAFYDWLYIRALSNHSDFLKRYLLEYEGFTDIEFNPSQSINCQARTCAIIVSLLKKELFDICASSFEEFVSISECDSINQPHSIYKKQKSFL